MDNKNRVFQFDNGLVLLYEEMAWSESFAIGISVPAGAIWEQEDLAGVASITCEMTNRGAGEFSNRAFLETLENLGVRSSESASKLHANFGATGLCDNWERTLELLALQVCHPRLPSYEFEACRQIQLQEIAAIEDEPSRITTRAFISIFLPGKLGRPTIGTAESVNRMTIDDVNHFYQNVYRPNGTVITVAGRVDWEKLKDKVNALFGSWKPRELQLPDLKQVEKSTIHVPNDTAQTTVELGYMDVPSNSPDFLYSLGGVKVLSGGMSSRLFTEVREKRGLCYSVSASHYSIGNLGYVVCKCSTTAESAQQSVDVIIDELDRLRSEPITQSELERVKIRMKSLLVMQGESTARRAAAMAADWRDFERIIPLHENLEKVNSLTTESIEDYFANRVNMKFRMATSGPEPLSIPEERLF